MIITDFPKENRIDLWGNLQFRVVSFEKKEDFDLEKALKAFKGGKSRCMLHGKRKNRRK